MEQTIVARVPEGDVPEALLENIAASLAIWLDEGDFTQPERAAIVRHHARLELAFADIARQAPQPDLSTVQAWYLRHQTQFMRPEQRLTRHLLLTVDGDREAVHQRILGLYRQINASRDAFAPLAQRHSHCPSALEEGRLGWISRGLLYPQLETALVFTGGKRAKPSHRQRAGVASFMVRSDSPRRAHGAAAGAGERA